MNGPSQSTRVEVCCFRGVPCTRPNALIIVYTSLNCLCFRQCRKGLNVISCVQHVALWLCVGLCVQGWTLIKHVKLGPDRNEEVVPLWNGGLLLPVFSNVRWSKKNSPQSTQKQNGPQVKSPSNQFVVSCVLIIDWPRHCWRVCSPFGCMSSCSVWYGGKNLEKRHVNRMSVWISVSSRWRFGYDTVLMQVGIQSDIIYMCDEFGVHGKLYDEVMRNWGLNSEEWKWTAAWHPPC